jgi:hypothetical protein
MSTAPSATVKKINATANTSETVKPASAAKPVATKKAPAKPRTASVKSAVKKSTTSAPSKAVAAPSAKTPTAKTPTASERAKALKEKKVKVMRDSFTIPKAEFNQIAELKKRAVMMGVDIKKSELIRAGLMLINGLSDIGFKKALAAVPAIKTGRPSKD